MRALDLFCGAGGATRGLQNAGFHVTGVDLKRSPRYCGDDFWQGDVFETIGAEDIRAMFDFVWASPPCQAHTSLKTMPTAKRHADLIPQTRALLRAAETPYVIENVMGAPLENPCVLCGTMFGLGVRDADLERHRQFEASFPLVPPGPCRHGRRDTIGVYGDHFRNRRRRPIVVTGHTPYTADNRGGQRDRGVTDFSKADGQEAMGIDWMTNAEISQAIPPAYSEFIARAWLAWRALL